MNENTTADTSVNATAIDDETLSRAVLTYCLDSADAMMYALVKGIGSATHTLQLLADSGPGNHESVATAAYKTLDAALINGITRWGRTINARGMASFHGAMVSWQHRLTTLPSTDPEELKTWFTANGTQWIVAPHHPYWPSQLADLTIHTDWAAPLCLWGKGDPPSVGVMLRTGRCRRITRRKRVRKAKRTRARQTSGPSRPSHSVRRRSGHRCGRPLGSHPSHGRDRNAPRRTHRRGIRRRTQLYRSEKQRAPLRNHHQPFRRAHLGTLPRNRSGSQTIPYQEPPDSGAIIHPHRSPGTRTLRRA